MSRSEAYRNLYPPKVIQHGDDAVCLPGGIPETPQPASAGEDPALRAAAQRRARSLAIRSGEIMDFNPYHRARASVYAASMNPDINTELVRYVAIAICEAHMEGIKQCNELWKNTAISPCVAPPRRDTAVPISAPERK